MEEKNAFGTLTTVDLKEVWPGEATHFTPWLSNNFRIISEKIGDMELELLETEASAGAFQADIVALDIATNRIVIIENQFGSTDHKHLGQLLTYASSLNAQAVIWIAETIRPEHKQAIDFLNNNLKESLLFYAIEVSLLKIDNSQPAYMFTIISQPAVKETVSARASVELSEGKERYRAFFQSLIDTLRTEHGFTNARIGQPQNWYTFASENSRVYKYSASFAQGGRIRAELYIDMNDKERNEKLFDALYSQKDAIEEKFGGVLEWEKLDKKRACRVASYIDGSIDDDTQQLDTNLAWLVEKLLQLKKVFPPFIDIWLKQAKNKTE